MSSIYKGCNLSVVFSFPRKGKKNIRSLGIVVEVPSKLDASFSRTTCVRFLPSSPSGFKGVLQLSDVAVTCTCGQVSGITFCRHKELFFQSTAIVARVLSILGRTLPYVPSTNIASVENEGWTAQSSYCAVGPRNSI